MDDFNLHSLNESRNEYSALLIGKLTPLLFEGIKSIFKEAYELCKSNDENEKYLMTFQNFLSRVSKWNQTLVETETERIIKRSGCDYLEDLLSCVYINQLKILTSMRVGSKQKQIDIDIPRLSDFIHRVYIYVARKVYKNVYLFDMGASPIDKQKNVREIETMIRESILEVIRDGMPIERILRAYLDKTVEEDTFEVREEIQTEELEPEIVTNQPDDQQPQDALTPQITDTQYGGNIGKEQTLEFNNTDLVKEYNTQETPKNVAITGVVKDDKPKTIDVLEQISAQRHAQRQAEDEDDYDSDDDSDNDFVIQHKFMKPSTDVLDFDTFDEPTPQKSASPAPTMQLLDVEEI
jgi:hypothetical protein